MKDVGDFVDLLFENAKRVGIRQHEGCDVFIHLRLQRGDINHPFCV